MMMPPELEELSDFAARIGADSRLVQGGGGNVSIKVGPVLWVKASGHWLARAREQNILVPMDRAGILALVQAGGEEPTPDLMLEPTDRRPSIESSLHAVFPHRVVVHVHSVNALARMLPGDRPWAARLHGLRWGWLPYHRPGLPLTRAVLQLLATARETPDLLLLANHGVVIGAGDVAAAHALLQDMEDRLQVEERPVPAVNLALLQSRLADLAGWRLPSSPALQALALDEVSLALLDKRPLYPDHVVYLGVAAGICRKGESVAQAVARLGEIPYLVIPGEGVLVADRISPGAEAMLEALSLVGRRLASAEGLTHLSDADCRELLHWEAELFRKMVDPHADPSF